mgnify:CR=1 FL=1|tara:strand:- start:1269 stop:1766 length:498 start_codon:yes stop_codon:yes gene_type:complete
MTTFEEIPYWARSFADANVSPNPDVFIRYSNNTKAVKETYQFMFPHQNVGQNKKMWDVYRSRGEDYRIEFYNRLLAQIQRIKSEEQSRVQLSEQEVTKRQLEQQLFDLNTELAKEKIEHQKYKINFEKAMAAISQLNEDKQRLMVQVSTYKEIFSEMRGNRMQID